MTDLRIAIVTGSTRPARSGAVVSDWVFTHAQGRAAAGYELIDLADHLLPFFDEAVAPAQGRYANEHTRAWAQLVDGFDGYVFVTPEYNHSTSAVLKNALDFVYAEWNDKAAGFVSYGYGGGLRAVEHLRQIASALQMAHVTQQVSLSMITDFDRDGGFQPNEHHLKSLGALFDQLERWAAALRPLRVGTSGA